MNRLLMTGVFTLVGVAACSHGSAFGADRGSRGSFRAYSAPRQSQRHSRVYYKTGYSPSCQTHSDPQVDEDVDDSAPLQSERYLHVKNETADKLTVYVQYRTALSSGKWVWLPEDPEKSQETLAYDLEPGEEMHLGDGQAALTASRVRLWAVTENGDGWLDYKDKDLWLVPEEEDGQHCYYADEVETFPFTFSD